MSWSVSLIGKAANVAKALEEHSASLSGQSKIEYDEALPHLIGLVNQNFVQPDAGWEQPTVQINATGSGYAKDGAQMRRQVSVVIQSNYVKLV